MESRAEYVARRRRELEAQRRQAEQDDPVALGIAGEIADDAAIPLGIGLGLFHAGEAIGNGVGLAARAAIPIAPGHAQALGTIQGAAHGLADYGRTRRADPSLLPKDFQAWAAEKNRELNPDATPMAPTIGGEMLRRARIGLNEGELALNLAPVAAEVKGAAELGRFAGAGPAKYLRMGATPEQAAYLSERAPGAGHHSIIPQRAKMVRQIPFMQKGAAALGLPQLPEAIFRDFAVPKALMDSRFNVVRPNVERGMMYQRHFGLDKHYYGGRVSGDFGGGGWSGRKLGWKKYGPAARAYYGTPGALKAGLAGALGPFGLLGSIPDDLRPDP